MTHTFAGEVLEAVLRHMNSDHSADNILIVRAQLPAKNLIGAVMTGLDGDAGIWRAELVDGTSLEVRVPWPGGPITERAQIRSEILALYQDARRTLGEEPDPHEISTQH